MSQMQALGNTLGRLLGRIGASNWTPRQRKHVANLIGKINRVHNQKQTPERTVQQAARLILKRAK